MNCKNVRKHLNDYVDSLLDKGLKESVDAHLQNCPACMEELEALRALRQRVRGLHRVSVSPPPDFLVKVHRRLEREGGEPSRKQPRPRFRPLRIPVSIAALATAVIALVFVLNTMLPREKDRPESAKKTALKDQVPLMEDGRVSPEGAGSRDFERAEPETDDHVSKARTPAEENKAPEVGSEVMTTRALDESTAAPAPALIGAEPFELVLNLSPEGVKAARSPTAESEAPESEPERKEKGVSLLAERQGASKSEDALSSEEEGQPSLSEASALPFIEKLTRDLGGAVHSLDYDEQTGFPRSITVEIPAAALEEFSAALTWAGELEGEEELREETMGPGPVSIRILMISHQEQ